MICSRCGTEHYNNDKICPRCGLGKPKERKTIPAWLKWSLLSVLVAGVGVLSFWLYTIISFDSDWINGAWDGGGLSINFNDAEGTFLLSSDGEVLEGTYEVQTDTITLVTNDEQTYVYRYEKISNRKMKLTFNRDDEVERITVQKDEASVEEESDEDRSDELSNNQSGFVS